MSKVNPYEVTGAVSRRADTRIEHLKIGLVAITVVFTIAVFVGVMAAFIPRVRAFTLPRFGGYLIMCANPIIFLVSAIRCPTRTNLIFAGLVTVAMGVINASSLWQSGTVPAIYSEYSQRLHSSWLWAVLPFFVAGSYIFLSVAFLPSKPAEPTARDQT